MNFIDYIHEQTHIENETLELLDTLFEHREYKKYSLLLKEGSLSKEVFYIEEGIVRQFYTKDGKDITHAFYAENSFYTSIENIYFHNPKWKPSLTAILSWSFLCVCCLFLFLRTCRIGSIPLSSRQHKSVMTSY